MHLVVCLVWGILHRRSTAISILEEGHGGELTFSNRDSRRGNMKGHCSLYMLVSADDIC